MKQYFAKEIEGELMLCSRDIQVGDRVYCPESKPTEWCKVEWIVDDLIGVTIEGSTDYAQDIFTPNTEETFKPIGKISPSAIWVKDGDGFGCDAWRQRCFYDYNAEIEGDISYIYHENMNVCVYKKLNIEIFGPCGHFH